MHWTGKVESVAFEIFGKPVAWYGIIITTAMLVGLFAAAWRLKKFNIKLDDLLEVFLIAIPLAVIFGRLGYVIPRFSEYFLVPDFGWADFVRIIAVWDGGITIMTGVPGGVLGGFIWCRWRKVDFLKALDVMICVVLLSQAIGRWGNFMNQELYGAAITDPSQQWFPLAVYIAREGGWFQALFFYEMVLNFLGFLIIMFFTDRVHMKGFGTAAYVAAYGIIRFIMEFFRDDGHIYDVVNYNQIICGLVGFGCLVFIAVRLVMLKKQGKRIWYPKGVPVDVVGSLWLKREDKKKDGDGSENNAEEEGKTPKKHFKSNKSKKRKSKKQNPVHNVLNPDE